MSPASTHTYTTQAICLKAFDYSEADKIVTLYSPDRGRIQAIVKGARRATSKLAGVCELLTVNQAQLATGRNMDVLTQYQPTAAYPVLRSDLTRMAFALLLTEQLFLLSAENDADSHALFSLLQGFLDRLEHCTDPAVAAIATDYQLQLFDLAGYQPQLANCIVCDRLLSPVIGIEVFSAELGGLVCIDCKRQHPSLRMVTISPETLNALQQPMGDAWQNADPIKVQKFLEYYLTHKLEAPVRAYSFVYQVLAD